MPWCTIAIATSLLHIKFCFLLGHLLLIICFISGSYPMTNTGSGSLFITINSELLYRIDSMMQCMKHSNVGSGSENTISGALGAIK